MDQRRRISVKDDPGSTSWMNGRNGRDGRDSRDGFVYVYFRVSFRALLGFVLEFLLEFPRWDCWEGRDGRGGRVALKFAIYSVPIQTVPIQPV